MTNVTQLIVIDYYYHAVIMLSMHRYTDKRKGEQEADEQEYYLIRVILRALCISGDQFGYSEIIVLFNFFIH